MIALGELSSELLRSIKGSHPCGRQKSRLSDEVSAMKWASTDERKWQWTEINGNR